MAASSKPVLVSIVIPTLNSETVLTDCLNSIKLQKFDQSAIQIIICDGGSSDKTLVIAKSFNCQILNNKLKTAESGKALGIKKAIGKYIALIDSDNILPDNDWLNIMLSPFIDESIIGSEPWAYTYRPTGGFIERYSALTGVNDPYALIANNYDRINHLRTGWNGLSIHIDDNRYYQSFSINQRLPTIGANGTIYRKNIIDKYFNSSYLIDIDILNYIASKSSGYHFAKVKCDIVHSYCESSISKFIKKQNRRAVDLYVFQSSRPKSNIANHTIGSIKFTLYVILIFPMLIDTLVGVAKKPDPAWLFHPIASIITLYVYAISTIKYKLGLLKPINRQTWSQ